MGVTFLLMGICTSPLMFHSLFGDMTSSNPSEDFFMQSSVANLGSCGEAMADCPTVASIVDRPLQAGGAKDKV